MITTFTIRTVDIASIIYQVLKIKPTTNIDTRADYHELNYYICTMYSDTTIQKKLYKHFFKNKLCQRHKISNEYGNYKKLLWIDRNKINEQFNTDIQIDETPINLTRLTSRSLFDDIRYYLDNHDSVYLSFFTNSAKLQMHHNQDRHFTINNKGEMTYTPKGKMTKLNSDGQWIKDGRQSIKHGKGLRKIFSYLPYLPDDHIIEKIQNHLRSKYTFTGQIQVVEGDDIKKWYYGSRYASNQGTLNDSCMRHNSCQDYFEIYTINPKKVKMIIALNDEQQLIGRALLWHTDDDFFFCDRIYGLDITVEAIKTYAKNNFGAYVKESQSYSCNNLVSTTGEIVEKDITVTLSNPQNHFPYMDTLKYCDDIESDTIILNNIEGDYSLTETDGGPNDFDNVTLHNGDRCHEDDARYVDRFDEYYHMDDVYFSEHLGEYIPTEVAVLVNDQDYVWDDSDEFCYPEDSDGAYWIDDCTYSEYDECYYIDADECPIKGYVSASDMTELTIGNETFQVHRDVTAEDLYDHGLITQDSLEQANHTTNE